MKLTTLTLCTIVTLLLVSMNTYALPLSDKAVNSEVVTTVDPPATTTDAKPVLTKQEKKAQRKMKKMQKRMEKLATMSAASEDRGKTAAIIGYITIFGWLISLLAIHEKGEELSAFHLRQYLGLFLTAIVGSIILAFIPIVGWILLPVWSLLFLIAWIIGLIGAINGEMKPVFLFGKKFQKWFSGIS